MAYTSTNENLSPTSYFQDIAKGTGHRPDFGVSAQSNEGRREKIDGLRFQYLARVLIALATAIDAYCSDFSRHVEKSMLDLTPQPPSLQGKGEN